MSRWIWMMWASLLGPTLVATADASPHLGGHVTDVHGVPIRHAQVSFVAPGGYAQAETDSAGVFEMTVPQGDGTLSINWQVHSYLNPDSSGTSSPDSVATPRAWSFTAQLAVLSDRSFELVVPAPVTMTVHVSELDGRSVRRASVSSYGDSVGPTEWSPGEYGIFLGEPWGQWTDSVGVAKLVSFPTARRSRVVVTSDDSIGFASHRQVEVNDLSVLRDTTITVTLPPIGNTSVGQGILRSLSLTFANPSHGHALLSYFTPAANPTRVLAFDVQGRTIAVLVNGYQASGVHQYVWNADLRSGVYFLVLESGPEHLTKRLVLLR